MSQVGKHLKSVIITGASGFMGRALTSRLEGLGIEFVGLSSRDADLMDPRSLDRYNQTKYDHIFHLAGWTQVGDSRLHHLGEQWLINQQINTTVLRWWQSQQPQAKLVSIGTSSAYEESSDLREENYLAGNPAEGLYTYGMTKRMLLVGQMGLSSQFGLRWLTVVPSTIYGPSYQARGRQMHFVFDITRKILEYKYSAEPIVLWGDGYQRRELVHVRDFVNNALALNDLVEDTVVNVGQGGDQTIREFAEILCRAAGVDPAVISYDTSRPAGSKTKRLNTDKLERLLPERGRISLEDGLCELVADMERSYQAGQPATR